VNNEAILLFLGSVRCVLIFVFIINNDSSPNVGERECWLTLTIDRNCRPTEY